MFLVFVFVLSCTEKANGTEHQAEPEPAESQLDQENRENRDSHLFDLSGKKIGVRVAHNI